MGPADVESLVKDIFAEQSADLHIRPYKPEDRDAEAAKIARLRRLRLAQADAVRPPRRASRGLIVTR